MHDAPSADRDYDALRREHERRIDGDYRAWRQQRFHSNFDAWRRERQRTATNDVSGTGMLRSQAGSLTTSVGMGGVPSTSDARLSPSMSGASDLTSDASMDPRWSTHRDLHFERLRADHERQLDTDYAAWRRERSSSRHADRDVDRGGDEPRDESPLQSLGRAVSETVTAAPRSDDTTTR